MYFQLLSKHQLMYLHKLHSLQLNLVLSHVHKFHHVIHDEFYYDVQLDHLLYEFVFRLMHYHKYYYVRWVHVLHQIYKHHLVVHCIFHFFLLLDYYLMLSRHLEILIGNLKVRMNWEKLKKKWKKLACKIIWMNTIFNKLS